jgi:hypothetical protein
MRTTLELPDELFRQLKSAAALQGTTIKKLMTRYVESGLRQPEAQPAVSRKRSKLPIIKRRDKSVIPSVTPELQARLEQEADHAKLNRSFGR